MQYLLASDRCSIDIDFLKSKFNCLRPILVLSPPPPPPPTPHSPQKGMGGAGLIGIEFGIGMMLSFVKDISWGSGSKFALISNLRHDEDYGVSLRIYHEYEGGIEKSVPRITHWHHEACRVMTIGEP